MYRHTGGSVKTGRGSRAAVAATALVAGLIVAPAINQAAHAAPFNFGTSTRSRSGSSRARWPTSWPLPARAAAETQAPGRPGTTTTAAARTACPTPRPTGSRAPGRMPRRSTTSPRGGRCGRLGSGSNVKVNQNCLNVSDPTCKAAARPTTRPRSPRTRCNPTHLVASDNDYVRGDGTCGASYSTDGGTVLEQLDRARTGSRAGLGGNAAPVLGGRR